MNTRAYNDTCAVMYPKTVAPLVPLVYIHKVDGGWETETMLTECQDGLLTYYVLSSMVRHNGQYVHAERHDSSQATFSAACDAFRIKSPVRVWLSESVAE